MRSPIRSVLSNPLLGDDPRRSAAALGYVAIVSTLVLASGLRRGLGSFGVFPLPGVLDQLSAFTIILAMASTFLLAIAYPLWNGGPLLAAVIPLVPPLSGALAVRSVAMDVDMTLALAAGALGATIAVFRTGTRRSSGWAPIAYPGVVDGAVIASVPTVLAGLSVSRLFASIGPHAMVGVWVALGLTVLAAVGLAIVWGTIGTAALAKARADADGRR